MATPPAGWRQRVSNENEYEAILDLGNFEKYEINVNVQTGQRQIYTIDPVLRTREFVGTINSDGSTIRQEAWTNISGLPNGQTRLKKIIDSSRIAANTLVEKVGTESQIKSLQEQKEFAKLKGSSSAPSSPGAGSQDESGANAGGDNAASGSSQEGGTPPSEGFGNLRNVSNYQSEDDRYGDFSYPYLMNLEQDHIVITTYNYQVADVFAGSDGISNINSGSILNGASLSARTFKNRLGSVTLPMPSNISEANQTGWGEDSLSSLTAGLMGGAINAASYIAGGKLLEGGRATIDTAKSTLSSESASTQIKQLLTLNAASALVKKLGVNVNTEAYRARVTGTVINPNLELLFNGPKLRQFQFSFKLAPRSDKEARQIRGIIKFFKKAMAPKRGSSGDDGFFLGAPNVFRIQFKNGKNESRSLPTLKTCALVNFNVNYTADGFYSAFVDGQPISVQIDLAFAELTPIYNDNYGDDDSVGFKGGTEKLDDLENPLFSPKDPSERQDEADRTLAPPPPPSGGASAPAAVPTRIFQPGGPTAIPGDPNTRRPDQPGGEPVFQGGVRGV